MMKTRDSLIQGAIGWVLRFGVLLSIAIVIVGGIIYLCKNGHTTANYHTFKGVPAFVQLSGIIDGLLQLRGQAVIQAGILILIATPVLRVVFSAIGFILEKDYLYTFITLLVLSIIIVSMLSGHVG